MTRRDRSPEALDPVVEAELEVLERALAGHPGPGDDPLLAELVREVRADAPVMDPAARASLDARVLAGFPRDTPAAPRAAWRRVTGAVPRGALLRPALGVAAAAVLALVVALSVLSGGEDHVGPSAVDGGVTATKGLETATEESSASVPAPAVGADDATAGGALQRGLSQPSTAPVPPLPPPGANPGRLGGTRRVERSAELTLSTAPEDVQDVADDVVATVQALGGVVATSRVATSETGGEAFFDLRLPTSRLDQALAQLSKLASVAALSQNSQDITGSFVSATDRLQDARDERAALLKALGRATTDRQVASLRARLADSRRRIARAEAEIRRLRARTDRATVALTVRGDGRGRADEDEGGGAWTPGDAARDALRVLEVAAGVLVVAAAVAVPVALLALVAWLLARGVRRRGRERALDATA